MSDDFSNRTNIMPTVWLAIILATVGPVALVFGESFVLGKRGFRFLEGSTAQIAGCFWLMGAAALLAKLVPNPALRKCINVALAAMFLAGVIGIFGYLIYALLDSGI